MDKLDIAKIKDYFLKRDNLIILILTGVLFLVIAWPVPKKEQNTDQMSGLWDRTNDNMNHKIEEGAMTETEDVSEDINEINELEEKLENMLSSMNGVGKVKVMITFASGSEKVIAKDTPLERNHMIENDSAGGNRSTSEMYSKEETVYLTNSQGEKIPYIIQENPPTVEGVSVVAEGGDHSLIQKNISEVIQVLFGIEEHKIKVVKMKFIE